MKKTHVLLFLMMLQLSCGAQNARPLPPLHVEGRWMVDTHGNHVVLHGVMDTPNTWFNGGRWGRITADSTVYRCINYFNKLFTGLEKAHCNVFRLHMDPCWTNDPSVPRIGNAGEHNISQYKPERLEKYLETLYFPIAKLALEHGMYVVVRPPGVCPPNLKVGDEYQSYLLDVWDRFSKNDSIKKYSGQISIELANEPVTLNDVNGTDSPTALHDYFQPMVDIIRRNGFNGIVWAPGTGWQSNYKSYATHPIEGYNIGYAVHDYTGWYGCSDDHHDAETYIRQFGEQVPVVENYPIIITEVDWSPEKEGAGHYNEHGEWVKGNYGTWSTGSSSKWGQAYKALLDHYGNISMTLSATGCLIDIDSLLQRNKVLPAFGGLEEACGKTCMDWYADYWTKDFAHAIYNNVSQSDMGDGNYRNPVIRADFPDPDVIRVGDTFYMVSTTMYHFPGATLLMSKDLVNWQYFAQPLKQLADKPNYNLAGGANAYARGMWATALVHHNDTFYMLLNGNDTGCWLMSAKDPQGEWNMQKLDHFYYDAGMLFDDNGMVYVVGGNTNLTVFELDKDFHYVREKTVITDRPMLEGSHFYKIGDYYYIYSTYGGYPSGQTVFRSKNVFGPYEERRLIEKHINGHINTVHQGALFDTESGQWWSIMQEDLGALGRMPNLQPVTWQDGWPVVGNNGVPYKQYRKPEVKEVQRPTPLPTNDNFRNGIGMQWQWNHNPRNAAWSLTERKGWLRLHTTDIVDRLTKAPNTLTQRIFAFEDRPTIGTIRMDVSHLADGNYAGICIFQDPQAMIGVRKEKGKYYIVWQQDTLHTVKDCIPMTEKVRIKPDSIVYLRATIDFNTGKTLFFYSLDNKRYNLFGKQTSMFFNLSVFVGARFGLFCYATKDKHGWADFDWFSTEDTYTEEMFQSNNDIERQ